MKIKLDFENISRKFNSARLDCKENIYEKKFFVAILTGIFGIKIDSVLLRTLKSNNIIIVENGYKFPKNPIYKEKIKRAYEEAVTIRKTYNDKYKTKISTKVVEEQPIEISQEESIATAIQILKEAGYRIYKPVTSFEEI